MIQQPKPIGEKPSEEKLKLFLKNGPEMILVVEKLIETWKLPFSVETTPEGLGILKPTLCDGEMWLSKFISKDEETLAMLSDARKISHSKYEVLITGETGTGKELLARSMIAEREGPIKSVNCAGFPEQLIESELFGHEKGAFTGADSTKVGLFQSARNGVMFLDEISELPLHLQSKLLRVLQEKVIRKVGSNKEEEINCKFVCATNRNIRTMVEEGKFKIDLYARISTLELDIKPLRERKCDLVPITESLEGGLKFLERYGKDLVEGRLDISLNVRSLLQHVTRFNVLGKLHL